MKLSRMLSLSALLVSICALSGCTPKGGNELTGKVSYKGTPIQNATITLISAEGTPYNGYTGKDGAFAIASVPPGQYKVTIRTSGMASGGGNPGAAYAKAMSGGKSGPANAGPPKSAFEQKAAMEKAGVTGEKLTSNLELPIKYGTAESSGLSWDTKDSKTKDFDLVD
jgi:Carboxypeptidase regulatory-like domain